MQRYLTHASAYAIRVALASALLLATAPALAEWSLLFGVGGGQSEVQDYSCEGCGISSVDDTDTSYLASLGIHYKLEGDRSPLIPRFGLVTEYVDLGDLNGSGVGVSDKLEASAWTLMLSPTWELGHGFNLFTESGLAWWSQKVTYRDPGFQASDTFDDSDPVYGVGIGYRFGDDAHWGVKAKWMRFKNVGEGDDPDLGHEYDIDFYGVIIDYQFPI